MASLAKAFNIADMAALAGRALPRPIRDYLEGGADDEWPWRATEPCSTNGCLRSTRSSM